MELIQTMQNRRSIRKYSGEPIPEERLEKVLQAGLLSASGRSKRPWEFIVVRDKAVLNRMAACREGAAEMLKGADTAVVVIADPDQTDVWIEDCSIAMSNMHLIASSQGIGSCWIQGRLRDAAEGGSTEECLRAILGYPERFRLEAVLSMGMPGEEKEAHSLTELPVEKIHREIY